MVEIVKNVFVESEVAQALGLCDYRQKVDNLADLREWLSHPENENDENFSDIFKEVYGVRP